MTVLGFVGGSHCVAGDAEKLRAAGAALIFDDMRRLPELVLHRRLWLISKKPSRYRHLR